MQPLQVTVVDAASGVSFWSSGCWTREGCGISESKSITRGTKVNKYKFILFKAEFKGKGESTTVSGIER